MEGYTENGAGTDVTDQIGFALAALVLGWHIWRSRTVQPLTI